MSNISLKLVRLVYAILFIALSTQMHAEKLPKPLGVVAPGEKMHFSIGNDVDLQIKTIDEAKKIVQAKAQGAAKAKATAFEPYVKWMIL